MLRAGFAILFLFAIVAIMVNADISAPHYQSDDHQVHLLEKIFPGNAKQGGGGSSGGLGGLLGG